MAINPTKLYRVNRVLVEATLSEGRRFYDVKIVETGEKLRCPAKAFEKIAKEVKK